MSPRWSGKAASRSTRRRWPRRRTENLTSSAAGNPAAGIGAGAAVLFKVFYSKPMSIRGGLVRRLNWRDSSAAMAPAARLKKELSDALHVLGQIRPLRTTDAGAHGGDAQARQQGDQGGPHARQWRSDAARRRRAGAHRGRKTQCRRRAVRGGQGGHWRLRDLRAAGQGRSGGGGGGIHAASQGLDARLGRDVRASLVRLA